MAEARKCSVCGATSYSANVDDPVACATCGAHLPPPGKGRPVQFIFLGADIDGEYFYHDGILLIQRGTPPARVLHIIEAFLSGRTPDIA